MADTLCDLDSALGNFRGVVEMMPFLYVDFYLASEEHITVELVLILLLSGSFSHH